MDTAASNGGFRLLGDLLLGADKAHAIWSWWWLWVTLLVLSVLLVGTVVVLGRRRRDALGPPKRQRRTAMHTDPWAEAGKRAEAPDLEELEGRGEGGS